MVIDINKNRIHEFKANFKRDCTSEESMQKAHFGSALFVIMTKIQENFAQKFRKDHKSIRTFMILGALFIFFVTWGVYSLTGNPKVKSYFFSELMNKDPKMLNEYEKVVRLQALFFRTPNDGKIADALAVGYFEIGHFQDSVNTYVDALRLNGESPQRLVGYGLALVGYENGVITQEAQSAFQKAADLAPNDFYPFLLLASAFQQAKKFTQAVQILQNFLDRTPEDITGRSQIEAMIAYLRSVSNQDAGEVLESLH
ncbi:cytochrome c-type biogenesis protein CycH [Bartonella australis AUST/NH1]|uniref:Cytochrome c-type biogenesis protein CycH n=1 Tax=Bartonella australis (strain Aust/NH1) TaxID=1094489 RepID=M1NSE9_BARAA|nr:tetratricopeptide repeat protein [Bartonella australis]AGF74273.1 cytochrome c-type biogenesis protein CycH [Bartonella australis AUST/NH1]